jgi:DNA-binding transcriptional regulator LsrR (DeoR family)
MTRRKKGAKIGRPSKWDDAVIEWVRVVYWGRHATQSELARFLNVSQSTVHRMISN